MLTPREAAHALRVSPRTIYRLVAADKLPHTRIGKRLFIFKDRVAEVISQGGIPL